MNNSEPINSEPVAIVVCPKCGNEALKGTHVLEVTFPEYEGEYCMKCWAKWISENIPKMEKKP